MAPHGDIHGFSGDSKRMDKDAQDSGPRVELLSDGILRVDFGERARITVAGMQLANRAHRALSGTPRPVLVSGTDLVSVEEDAMGYCSDAEIAEVTSAMALIVHSLLARHLGNLFLSYYKPPYPVKLFGDEQEARRWLRRHLPSAE